MSEASRSQRRRARFLERNGGRCYLCGEPLTLETMTVDHYVPRALGGSNRRANLRLACAPCNHRKGCAPPPGYAPAPRAPEVISPAACPHAAFVETVDGYQCARCNLPWSAAQAG